MHTTKTIDRTNKKNWNAKKYSGVEYESKMHMLGTLFWNAGDGKNHGYGMVSYKQIYPILKQSYAYIQRHQHNWAFFRYDFFLDQ